MKSKMKSTFAIIAVVLMVLVAVVPMVSMFTSETDADTTYDPVIKAADRIKISGKVLTVAGTDVADDTYTVYVTWGKDSQYYGSVDVDEGAYELEIYEKKVTNVTVSIIKKGDTKYTPLTEFGQKTYKELTTGITVANFQSGSSESKVVTVYMGGTGNTGYKLYAFFDTPYSVAVDYELYDAAADGTKIGQGQKCGVSTDSTFKVNYNGAPETVYLKITKVYVTQVKGGSEAQHNITGTTAQNIASSASDLIADQDILTVSTNVEFMPDASIEMTKGQYVPAGESPTPVDITMYAAGSTTLTSAHSVKYYYNKVNTGTTAEPAYRGINKYIAVVKWSSDVKFTDEPVIEETKMAVRPVISADVLASKNLYFGSIAMVDDEDNTVPAIDGQEITLKATKLKDDKREATGSAFKYVVSGGNYIALATGFEPEADEMFVAVSVKDYTAVGFGDDNNIIQVATEESDAGITDEEVEFGNADIVISAEGYTFIEGQLILDDEQGDVAASLGICISGVDKVFGYKVTKNAINVLTTDAGHFGVFIETGKEITFTPGADKDGNAEVYSFTVPYVYIANASFPDDFEMELAAKTLTFKLADGDGAVLGAVGKTLVVNYAAKSVLSYALGTGIAGNAVSAWNATPKTHTITVYKSYFDLTGAEFWPSFTNTNSNGQENYVYTFANTATNPAKYQETDGKMAISALDTTYYVYLKDIDGNIIKVNSDGNKPLFTAAAVDLYETETNGTIVRTTVDGSAYTVTADVNGKMKIMMPSTFVDVTIPKSMAAVRTVELTPATAPEAVATELAKHYLEAHYIFDDVDTDNTKTIIANKDTMTAKVVRLDETTGIPGVTVKLYKTAEAATAGGNDYVAVAVTDSKGSFTVNSPLEIVAGYTYKFEAAGYDIGNQAALNGTKKVTSFVSTTDQYYITITDADKTPVILTDGYKLSIAGTTITVDDYEAVGSIALTAGTVISATYKNGDSTKDARTFSPYTITSNDVATGTINLVSNERTCYINTIDADGNLIADGTPSVALMQNDKEVKTYAAADIIGGVTAIPLTIGMYYTVLTDLDSDNEYYAVKMANTGYDGTKYWFDTTEYTEFDDDVAVVESPYTLNTFILTDAIGTPVSVKTMPENMKVASISYPGDVRTVTFSVSSGTFSFVGDDSVVYMPEALVDWAFTDTKDNAYTVKLTKAVVDGTIKASEMELVFTLLDAAGQPIVGDATITYYNSTTPAGAAIGAAKKTNDNGQVSYVSAKFGEGYKYDAAVVGYTFDVISDFVFTADQATITPLFYTANGYPIPEGEIDNVKAYGFSGVAIATSVGGKITVDPEQVEYYVATPVLGSDFTFEKSEIPAFVANESYITGTVPYSGDQDVEQRVELDFYLEGNLVKYEYIDEPVDPEDFGVNGYEYDAIIDLSGMIIDGVVFDSIVAVYTEDYIVLGSTVIDPFTPVNNIISPIAQQFEVELVAPSAIVALHVNSAQVGNTVTVTADGKFIVADDESIYTDGQYIYTFAGWYVDNELVSPNPVFTFTMTENVMISPQYTVVYEKTSDVNKDVEKEYVNIVEKVEVPVEKTVGIDTNVLIIGICAVIVALIAVVYAVIKKE